ncbi:MAG TPA: AAA family ATPase [Longimicrobiaceae bacterium]|nr:AAA family ATPase [Longimicrobiaceae bacterium]
MSHVIAIANQKGGVGKTTTAVNLGASLAAAEQRTLVIDMDPQGNASSGLGVVPSPTRASLYGVLLDLAPLGSAIVRSVHLPFLDVVPTTLDLVGAEVELADQAERELRLRRALDGTRDMYDFVLIDCPPSMGLLTLNTLAAADSVLIPLQPEFFALEGLSQFAETIDLVRQYLNPSLGVEGVLLTMYDGRLKLAQHIADEATKFFGDRTFRTVIPRNVRLAEAPGFGKPVLAYDILSPGAKSYLALATELITRAPMLQVDRHGADEAHTLPEVRVP